MYFNLDSLLANLKKCHMNCFLGARIARAPDANDSQLSGASSLVRAPQRCHGHLHHLQELRLPHSGRAGVDRQLLRI